MAMQLPMGGVLIQCEIPTDLGTLRESSVGMLSTYLCPDCDRVHIAFFSELGSIYKFALHTTQAEEFARRLLDPQPAEHVELII